MENAPGIIRITKETPDSEAVAALMRALFAFLFSRASDEFTEVVFNNRKLDPLPGNAVEVFITHRTPDPTKDIIMALRSAWARLNANQQIKVRFEIGRIDE